MGKGSTFLKPGEVVISQERLAELEQAAGQLAHFLGSPVVPAPADDSDPYDDTTTYGDDGKEE
jgi:hypothetical protein